MQDNTAFSSPSPLVLTAPLSDKLNSLRFPATLRIDPTLANGLKVPSVALIFQMRAVDRDQVHVAIGQLEQMQLDDVFALLDRLMGR